MKINLTRRQVVVLAAVKLLAVGAVFAQSSLTPSLFPAAYRCAGRRWQR
jgi:hypothetical protein